MKRQYLFLLILSSFLVGAYGCGNTDGRFEVSGTVTFNGTPIEKGAITFIPKDGKTANFGGPIVRGTFKARGIPGKMVVQCYGFRDGQPMKIEESDEPIISQEQYLPESCNKKSTSIVDVSASNRKFTFDLKSE